MASRVLQDGPEVRPDGGLAAADVDVENLHPLQFVDDRQALGGRQLAWVPPPGAGQAVHAGQVAGVGQFPGQADRRLEPVGKLLGQRQRGGGHGSARGQIIPDVARVAKARAYCTVSPAGTPAAAQAARALGCVPSELTTTTRAGLLRNDSWRVPKW